MVPGEAALVEALRGVKAFPACLGVSLEKCFS